jgi:hypothetical protein
VSFLHGRLGVLKRNLNTEAGMSPSIGRISVKLDNHRLFRDRKVRDCWLQTRSVPPPPKGKLYQNDNSVHAGAQKDWRLFDCAPTRAAQFSNGRNEPAPFPDHCACKGDFDAE